MVTPQKSFKKSKGAVSLYSTKTSVHDAVAGGMVIPRMHDRFGY
jgi:hypothetical protein